MSGSDTLFAVVLLTVFVVVVWAVMQPRYEFVLSVRGGKAIRTRGKVTAAFQETVAGIVRDNGVEHGWIAGERQGKRVRLAFSRGFHAGAAQQLRNAWSI